MSTPISQLPSNQNTQPTQDQNPNESQLVSEILKEINENDQSQINHRETPHENIPNQYIPPQPLDKPDDSNDLNDFSNSVMQQNDILSEMNPAAINPNVNTGMNQMNIPNMESQLLEQSQENQSKFDQIVTEFREPSLVLVIVALLAMFQPKIYSLTTNLLSKSAILQKNSCYINPLIVGIIGGGLFYSVNKYVK